MKAIHNYSGVLNTLNRAVVNIVKSKNESNSQLSDRDWLKSLAVVNIVKSKNESNSQQYRLNL